MRRNGSTCDWSRVILAAGSGALLALAFPRAGLDFGAWLAPGLLVLSGVGKDGGSAFRLGYVAGLTHFLCALYWLLFIPFPAGAIAGWLALGAYLALYPAVWVWLCELWFPGPDAARVPAGRIGDAIVRLGSARWPVRMGWALHGALVWTGLEMIRGRFLTGFPWNFLGASQQANLPLIQVVSVTGVYGLSFLLIWVSLALLGAATVWLRHPLAHWRWLADLLLPGAALLGVLAYGGYRLNQPYPSTQALKVALVQPSIPQTLIWDPGENERRFEKMLNLSRAAMALKPQLLVWPEAAMPTLLRYDMESYRKIVDLVTGTSTWLIIGAEDAEPILETPEPDDADFFNSSFLITPEGHVKADYRKRFLVIFGEYVPLSDTLPFLKSFTPIETGFTRGTQAVPFELTEPAVKVYTLICFEDVFPHWVGEYVDAETDFLLNLTNNGWFGESAAQWQHAINAAFRAVEYNVPLVRCTNNGLTCWVDPRGRLHEVYFGDSGDIYGAGVKMVEVPLRDPQTPRRPTFYHRYGDWFGWICVGWLIVSLLAGAGQRFVRRSHRSRT